MHKSQSSTIELTGQTPLGGDFTFRVTCPSSWRLFLWLFYTSDVFIMRATSLPPGFMAHEYSPWRGRGRGAFSKMLGAESAVFQIKLAGINAPRTSRPPFLEVVWRSSLQGSRWQLPCGIWGMNRWRCDEAPVFLCLCVHLFSCVYVCAWVCTSLSLRNGSLGQLSHS